jgi:CRP-like cAMP-binding protein
MLLKGIAVCKLILEIDPRQRAAKEQLEKLYTAQYGALPRRSGPHTPGAPANAERKDGDSTSPSATPELAIDVDLSELAPAVDRLPEIPLLSDLEREAFVELLGRVPLHRFEAGETVVNEGELGNSFFILVDGEVRIVMAPDKLLAELKPGAFFGEMAVIAPRRRRASVIATQPSEILEITRDELDRVTRHHPHVFSVLTQFTEQRLLLNLMVTSPLFAPFPSDERARLVAKFQNVKFLKDQIIIEHDKDVDGLYLIVSGEVEITCEDRRTKATLSEGEMFGETSLLLRSKARATVRATENTRALLLPRDEFNELIMTHPQILELVSELKERRFCVPPHESILPRDLMSEMDGGSALL